MSPTIAVERGHWPKGKPRNPRRFPPTLRKRISALTREGVISELGLAQIAGISPLTLRRWMQGRNNPSVGPLARLERAMDAIDTLRTHPSEAPRTCVESHNEPEALTTESPGSHRMASTERRRLKRLVAVATEIINGLEGRPFQWKDGEATAKEKGLWMIGVRLVTKDSAHNFGHRISSRAHPVGSRYFGHIHIYSDLYVLGVHTHQRKRKSANPAAAAHMKGSR